jgi:uncharacterized membrane protein
MHVTPLLYFTLLYFTLVALLLVYYLNFNFLCIIGDKTFICNTKADALYHTVPRRARSIVRQREREGERERERY